MATNFWICYEPVHGTQGYRAPEAEFKHPEGGHECPKCKHCNSVFPWRKFRCLGCGFEEEQGKFFASSHPRSGKVEDSDLDPDPVLEKWEYDCSDQNNRDCDSSSYEQIDESTEPPKQKLYILRRYQLDDVWYFQEERSKRAMTEIFFGSCPVGTRIAVQDKRYGRDVIVAEVRSVVLGTHAPIEAFQGDELLLENPFGVEEGIGYGYSIRAFNEKLDEYSWLLLFLPRATYGDRQDWTTDQWLEDMSMKDAAQAVRAVKAEEEGQRRMKEIETLIGDREKTNAFVIKHKDKTTEEILALAKRLVKRRQTKKN